MRLMIHTIQEGDVLTMIGPDGRVSERFTLAEIPTTASHDPIWIYREYDVPIVLPREYALDSTFLLHHRRGEHHGQHRVADNYDPRNLQN